MSEQWKRFVDILRSLWISGVTGLFFIRLWRTDTARWRREPCNPSKKNISGSTPAPYRDLNRVTLVRWLTPLHNIDIYITTLQLVTWERACVAPWPGLGVTLTMTLTLNNAQWSSVAQLSRGWRWVVQELELSCPGAGGEGPEASRRPLLLPALCRSRSRESECLVTHRAGCGQVCRYHTPTKCSLSAPHTSPALLLV